MLEVILVLQTDSSPLIHKLVKYIIKHAVVVCFHCVQSCPQQLFQTLFHRCELGVMKVIFSSLGWLTHFSLFDAKLLFFFFNVQRKIGAPFSHGSRNALLHLLQ